MIPEDSQPRIVIVEDNELDVFLLCDALKGAGFTREPKVLNDGAMALVLLKRESPFRDEPPPDLLILDLNLSLVDGPEVLQFVRETSQLQNIKVIILSSSPTDVMRTKAVNADGYFTKPSALDAFLALGTRIRECYYKPT